MTLPLRTGIVIVTVLVKHICHVLTTYRPRINEVIDAAVASALIEPGQATILKNWLDGAQAACDIVRLVSGY